MDAHAQMCPTIQQLIGPVLLQTDCPRERQVPPFLGDPAQRDDDEECNGSDKTKELHDSDRRSGWWPLSSNRRRGRAGSSQRWR